MRLLLRAQLLFVHRPNEWHDAYNFFSPKHDASGHAIRDFHVMRRLNGDRWEYRAETENETVQRIQDDAL
jgi:hypothetical protein